MLKRVFVFAGIFCALAGSADAVVENWNGMDVNIEFWTGSGSNEAMTIFDFGPGNSYAFGYRWDGEATGWDMFTTIAETSGSTITITPVTGQTHSLIDASGGSVTFSGTQYSFGTLIEGIGYQGHALVDDYYGTGESIAYYVDGAEEYSYSYWDGTQMVSATQPADPVADGTGWFTPAFGNSDRVLADGWWDGYTQGTYSEGSLAPVIPTPEPTSMGLLILGGLAMLRRRGK